MKEETKQITYKYKTPEELFQCYMQFLSTEGIFIPTIEAFTMNEDLLVSIILPTDDVYTFNSRVVWITPVNATGYHSTPGIGVEFPLKQSQVIISAILIILGNFDRYTHLQSFTLKPE